MQSCFYAACPMHYPVAPSVGAWGLPRVARGVVQSLRAYPWSLRRIRQLVQGMLVSWSVGVSPGDLPEPCCLWGLVGIH